MDLLRVFTWKEEEVFKRVSEAIEEKPTLTDGDGYAFWDRKSPICVQAHIDVVSSNTKCTGTWDQIKRQFIKVISAGKEEKVELVRYRNLIIRKDGILGGDDRAGVMAIMAINNNCLTSKIPIPLPSILLTNGEETGGAGMKAFVADINKIDRKIFDPVRLFIALDRRGLGEYVYYTDPPTEVKTYIESFGFNRAIGSSSDCKRITSEWKIPHVNLSIGYYDNHSVRETVHLDETMFTVKRVCSMLKDPIEKRYEVEEHKYVPTKWQQQNTEKNIGNIAKLPVAAIEKRRKRCNSLKEQFNFPMSCTCYPYLDYLLTNEAIIAGFHVVSTPESKGKTLEAWNYAFDKDSIDEVSKVWQTAFGPLEKIYVKSSYPHKFFLAVNTSDNPKILYMGSTCEMKEIQIDTKNSKEVAEKLAEIRVKELSNPGNDDGDYVAMHGYCARYSVGDCTGDCHGNRGYCNFPEGPWSFEKREIGM